MATAFTRTRVFEAVSLDKPTWPSPKEAATYQSSAVNANCIFQRFGDYTKPASIRPVLANTNLVISITNTDLIGGTPLSWHVQLKPNNSFAVVSPGKVSSSNLLTGSIIAADGSFSIKFRQTGGNVASDVIAVGAVSQADNLARGAYLSTNRATPGVINVGSITIDP
jgi:hypothetical protein